ncbi:hypothetical protein [Alcanivorax sp. 1008]|uniref:hypothetical protein n=1 Tax=Alcanivorax sp. 1008 TaxID=2816853 RepID=UPI001DBBBC41|nr:hypothetical protein [Alcanivorax sp. 1008]MCC1497361.1 hypothetical protein [Alcanivorax sp. 1008]
MKKFLKASIIGVGSYEIESFMSFFCRWAWLHFLTPSAFALEVARAWEDITGERFPVNAKGFHNVRQLLRPAEFSSAFLHASSIILDDLDLEKGTFTPLEDCISISCLINPSASWCGDCFLEHLDHGTTPYIRHYWTIRSVKRCLRHGGYLRIVCPHCGSLQDRLVIQESVAHCQSCRKFMAIRGDGGDIPCRENIDEHSIAMMHLCDLVSNGWRANRDVIRDNLLKILRARPFAYSPPHPYKRSDIVANDYYNVVSNCRKFIANRDRRISVLDILNISESVANISFLEVLTSERPVWQTALKLGTTLRLPAYHMPIRPVKDRHRDHFGVLHRFKQIASKEGEIHSLKVVAAKLGVSVGYLQYRFPSEVSDYRLRYKTYKEQDRRLRRAKAITVVRAYLADARWPEERVSRPKLVEELRVRTGLGRNDLDRAAIMVMGVGKAKVAYRTKPRSKLPSNVFEDVG